MDIKKKEKKHPLSLVIDERVGVEWKSEKIDGQKSGVGEKKSK